MKVQSRADLERDWSVEEVAVAHDILDALDLADSEARKAAEKR